MLRERRIRPDELRRVHRWRRHVQRNGHDLDVGRGSQHRQLRRLYGLARADARRVAGPHGLQRRGYRHRSGSFQCRLLRRRMFRHHRSGVQLPSGERKLVGVQFRGRRSRASMGRCGGWRRGGSSSTSHSLVGPGGARGRVDNRLFCRADGHQRPPRNTASPLYCRPDRSKKARRKRGVRRDASGSAAPRQPLRKDPGRR